MLLLFQNQNQNFVNEKLSEGNNAENVSIKYDLCQQQPTFATFKRDEMFCTLSNTEICLKSKKIVKNHFSRFLAFANFKISTFCELIKALPCSGLY